jgi:hypothetical protein
MRLTCLLFLCITFAQALGQSISQADPRILFEVSIASDQREFHIGERIPIQLSFSSTVKDHYQINMAQYDRGGRMSYEHFVVTPADGAVDPLPTYSGSMGGITGFQFLTPQPWTIKLNLNEWLRFTKPGEYHLVISSVRVASRDPSNAFGTSPVKAQSNEIALKIVPADPAWQKRVFSEAVEKLNAPAPARPPTQQYSNTRREAVETLRFLGTADAAREMVKLMRGEDQTGLDYICSLGLISSPERAVVRSALEEAFADPDHPVDTNFLYTVRMVDTDPETPPANWRADQQRMVEKLIAALPNKRGKALSISLSTAVKEAWNGEALPKELTDKLVSQLISMFDQLPVKEKNELLSYRWDKIGSTAMLPILKRYAQAYQDFPEMRDSNASASLDLSASALRHWYELDPAGARPAIITEITRPRPRYGARILGILPDKTLPEVDLALAEHLVASEDFGGKSNLASLIARYATDAIMPQVIETLDPKIGKWACAIQDPLLAYLLRVNPAMARPRIEQAIAARGENFSACNRGLFQGISEIHYDPILEELGIQSLDDPDPQVAMTAATMLGKFGSPAAESALWQRYSRWTAKWEGRESQLDLVFGDLRDDKIYELGLGQNLAQALVSGKSWLTDKDKLQRLLSATKIKRIQQELQNDLKLWPDGPLEIVLFNNQSSPNGFHGRIAQYEFHSMQEMKDKLAQFPGGTKFRLSISPGGYPANDPSLTELRAFLSERGMLVPEEKRDPPAKD